MKKKPIQDRWPEDEDAGLDTFREHMGGHPEPTEQLARTWFALLEQVERNLDGGEPDGLRDARRMLLQALRFTYPSTKSYEIYRFLPFNPAPGPWTFGLLNDGAATADNSGQN